MEPARSTILYPKRASAITHGRFVVDGQAISLQLDPFLNPIVVNAAIARLDQVEWLDSWDYIVCDEDQHVWELRKRCPGLSSKIVYVYAWHDMEIPEGSRELFVADTRPDVDSVPMRQLWEVTALTCDYTA